MNFNEAKKIIDSIESIDPIFNKLFEKIEQVQDDNLKKELRYISSSIVSEIYGSIINPIEIIFPDLIRA